MNATLISGGIALLMAATSSAAYAQAPRPASQFPSEEYNGVSKKAGAATRNGWTSLGTGKYRDNIMHTFRLLGDWYPEWDVEILESETTPGKYMVIEPYKNSPFTGFGHANLDEDCYIIVDASDPDGVMIYDWYVGFDFDDAENDQVGPLMLWSQAHDYYENLYGDLEQAKAEGLCGTLKNGAVTFNPGTLVVQIAPDYETHYAVWRPSNENGKWRLKLPGAPDLDISFSEVFVTDGAEGTLTVSVTMQQDVEKIRAAAINSADVESVRQAIVDGTADFQEFQAGGDYIFKITENGQYTVMLIPYYNGEPLTPEYIQKEYTVAEEGWQVCSQKALFSDGFIYGIEGDWFPWYESTGEVEVQKSLTEDGLIRLVDPFGPDCYAWANTSNYDTTKKYYMYLHIGDPEKVYIDEMSPIGLNIGYGDLNVWCKVMRWAELGMSEADQEPWWGKLKDGVVTFPAGGLYIMFPKVYQSWYSSNHKETFRLELPEDALSGIQTPEADTASNDGKAIYHDLLGVEVDGSSLRPGIYVRTVNGKSTKVIVK